MSERTPPAYTAHVGHRLWLVTRGDSRHLTSRARARLDGAAQRHDVNLDWLLREWPADTAFASTAHLSPSSTKNVSTLKRTLPELSCCPAGGKMARFRPATHEDPAALSGWLANLSKPCRIFACCDKWSRVVVRNAGIAGIRVPEGVALTSRSSEF